MHMQTMKPGTGIARLVKLLEYTLKQRLDARQALHHKKTAFIPIPFCSHYALYAVSVDAMQMPEAVLRVQTLPALQLNSHIFADP